MVTPERIKTVAKKILRKFTPSFVRKVLRGGADADEQRRIKRQRYCAEQARLACLTPWDFEELSRPMKFFCPAELDWWNELYGHAAILKQHAGLFNDFILNAGIQHGFLTNAHVPEENTFNYLLEFQNYPTALTWGNSFVEKIVCEGKQAIPIGAPFFYAKPSMSTAEMLQKKRDIGKTLLVMPVHNSEADKIDFGVEKFCEAVVAQKKMFSFDTVIICLCTKGTDWNEYEKIYRRCGFQCVTCGDNNDAAYLQRQKSLMMLSDAVMSNYVGSFVGYSLFLEKPFFLLRNDFRACTSGACDIVEIDKTVPSIIKEMNCQFEDVFHNRMCITAKQNEMCNLFWGANEVKCQKELLEIILNCSNSSLLSNQTSKAGSNV